MIFRMREHAFDRETDSILIARPHLHSMQRGKNLKGFTSKSDTVHTNI